MMTPSRTICLLHCFPSEKTQLVSKTVVQKLVKHNNEEDAHCTHAMHQIAQKGSPLRVLRLKELCVKGVNRPSNFSPIKHPS
jgi:hypothetical protein